MTRTYTTPMAKDPKGQKHHYISAFPSPPIPRSDRTNEEATSRKRGADVCRTSQAGGTRNLRRVRSNTWDERSCPVARQAHDGSHARFQDGTPDLRHELGCCGF